MSPEAVSPFPDRPIRPLPKRRLRERLSPDIADSIKYPPAPKTTTHLFHPPYNVRGEGVPNGVVESQHPGGRERVGEMECGYITRKCGDELDSDEDDAAYRSRIYSRHSETSTGRSYRYVQKTENKTSNPQPPASSASSADSYDSFENTNNKKKRKIPTPGDSSLNGGHLSDVLASLGISDATPEYVSSPVGAYHNPTVAASQGLSGPGRGRYGRVRNGRSPLRALSDSNWGNSRTVKPRHWSATDTPGIISQSIADANADKSAIAPAPGQENNSLLHQQASKKQPNCSTKFTFTCDSHVPSYPIPLVSNIANQNHPPSAPNARVNTQATQTSPNMPTASQNRKDTQAPAQAAPVKKNRRRRTGKEFLIAARERRKEQQIKNYHQPPAKEDIWICEFCEYEMIFGTPPEALIKQYEIKDRNVRKQEAERRRLLEKAKMKGRKGKKGNKTAAKNNPPAQDRQTPHPTSQAPLNQNHHQSQGIHCEEYYPNHYDDENEDEGSQEEDYAEEYLPPLSPTPAVKHRAQVVHPHPGKQSMASSVVSGS
ncbi:hypothetical protein BJ875DRAFT_369491 [Amylocarpus encephaloides]|uniref:Uncharacterized protein n=1 Tax=Amylocarpus encephaloides TaxID=45428 RepID=A0A9P7YQ38_9HELO|nr:hypothetical protein BJ875DRAFT_369491 [Amylocarpus encephaloides]